MNERRSNKNAASEDDLGLVHKLTTKLHLRRLQDMIKKLDEGYKIELVVDDKALAAAGKWAADQNGIGAAPAASDENTELNSKLREIRENQQAKLNQERAKREASTGNLIPIRDDLEEF